MIGEQMKKIIKKIKIWFIVRKIKKNYKRKDYIY